MTLIHNNIIGFRSEVQEPQTITDSSQKRHAQYYHKQHCEIGLTPVADLEILSSLVNTNELLGTERRSSGPRATVMMSVSDRLSSLTLLVVWLVSPTCSRDCVGDTANFSMTAHRVTDSLVLPECTD